MRYERLIDIFYLKEQPILPRPKLYRTRKEAIVGRFPFHSAAELDANRMYVAPDSTPADRHCPREAAINPNGGLFDLGRQPQELDCKLSSCGEINLLYRATRFSASRKERVNNAAIEIGL